MFPRGSSRRTPRNSGSLQLRKLEMQIFPQPRDRRCSPLIPEQEPRCWAQKWLGSLQHSWVLWEGLLCVCVCVCSHSCVGSGEAVMVGRAGPSGHVSGSLGHLDGFGRTHLSTIGEALISCSAASLFSNLSARVNTCFLASLGKPHVMSHTVLGSLLGQDSVISVGPVRTKRRQYYVVCM